MIKIIIADDNKLIRDSLKKFLQSEKDLNIVAESDSPDEIVELIKTVDADILLLDFQFPNKNGMEILKEVKSVNPDLNVIILSMHLEEKYASNAMKLGAKGYITKDADPIIIIDTIKNIFELNC
ncbi:MAG: response regulator transcription factor [Ignavibacteriales bacterium]|nr:response regulator transcription factor [Ignavibacteriales bacterium]